MKHAMLFLALMGLCLATDVSEKIAAIDDKIVQCNITPKVIATEQKALLDRKIRACSAGMTDLIREWKSKWDTEQAKKIAEYKAVLISQKVVLQKEVISEPNDIKPIEEIRPK